jgi:hypothetical protein
MPEGCEVRGRNLAKAFSFLDAGCDGFLIDGTQRLLLSTDARDPGTSMAGQVSV